MPSGYGFAGHFGLNVESVWGTPAAAADYVELMSEGVAVTFDRFDTKNIWGKFAEPTDSKGMKRIGGDLSFAAHPKTIGYFLKGVMGASAVTSAAGGIQSNVFTMATTDNGTDNPVPPWTFEISRDVTSAQQIGGIQMSRLTLAVTPNQDIRATVSVIGRVETDIAKSSPTFNTTPTEAFAFDTCSLSLGGVANADIEELSISIDNQLSGIGVLNAATNIAKVRRDGPQLIRVSGTIAFENITEYLAFKDGTKQSLVLHATRDTSYTMTIDVPQMAYTAFPLGMSGRDRQTVGFEGNGEYNVGSASALKVTLVSANSF